MSLPLVYDSADLWLASLNASGRSPKTLAIYSYAIDQLRAWRTSSHQEEATPHALPGHTEPLHAAPCHTRPSPGRESMPDLTTLSNFEALRFTRHLLDQYAATGVRSRIKSLTNFYNWCMTEELCSANPFAKVRVSVPDEAQPILSDETLDKVLASAKKHSRRDYAIVVLLADTGARKGEVASVRLEDVDLRSGTIHFPQSKTRVRSMPMSDRLVLALGHWMRERGTKAGSLWSVSDPYSLIKACVDRHGGKGVSPHQFRRRFAVTWLLRGGSEVGLQRVAGWSSSTMIKLYTQASADHLAASEFKRLMG